MPGELNMIKMAPGLREVDALRDWVERSFGGGPAVIGTRNQPKRRDELLDGGSIYWVFANKVLARQMIIGIEEGTDHAGRKHCRLILDREVVAVSPAPRKPFQGWRYLEGKDAPRDLPRGREGEIDLPEDVARKLAEIGIL